MESISTKPEQVAATTADLAQQIPHTEVGNPLDASSDEDRLVAGISTIVLQTRRPTGAWLQVYLRLYCRPGGPLERSGENLQEKER